MVACTSDDGGTPSITGPDYITAIMPQADHYDSVTTRSALAYDYASKVMKFRWNKSDQIKVFSTKADSEVNPVFELSAKNASIDSAFSARFIYASAAESPLADNEPYLAYSPYAPAMAGAAYTAIPFDFTGQVATANVKMAQYYASLSSTTPEQKAKALTAYNASEAAAAAHLGAKDYLVSDPVTKYANNSAIFPMKRIGVVARFFLQSPAEELFETLQLVVVGKPRFTVKGTLNVADKTLTPAGDGGHSNTMTLNYNIDGKPLDLGKTADKYNNPDFYYPSATKPVGYIVSYMMLPPIDFTDANKLYIYLIGKDSNGVKKYYRSKQTLVKPNLKSNMFYQWRTDLGEMPIEFEAVQVQQWQADTATDNGEDGKGTEGW